MQAHTYTAHIHSAHTERTYRAHCTAAQVKLAEREEGLESWVTSKQPIVRSATSLRSALRRHPLVLEQLKLWRGTLARSCLAPTASGPEAVDMVQFLQYLQLHLRLQKVRMTSGLLS